MKRFGWFLGVLLTASVALAHSGADARVVKGQAANAIAAQAAAYVSSITTLATSFKFITPSGRSNGHLFIDRGQEGIRMQFGAPLNHLLLVNGPLTQFFSGSGTNVRTATSGTPLEFLLYPEKSLANNIRVLEVDERGDSVYVAVAERGNEAAGQAILHFKRRPQWRLVDWGVYDKKGNYTQTVLGPLETGLRLDPSLFKAPADR